MSNQVKRVKYPRTPHLPWSLGRTSDDKVITAKSFTNLQNSPEVVLTEKMDGEATTIYADGYVHARSVDYSAHPSRNYLKSLAYQMMAWFTSEDIRVCGENLFAKHSIGYDNLEHHFMIYSVWVEDKCLSWDDTVAVAESMALPTVPLLYRGTFNQKSFEKALKKVDHETEGYVVRNAGSFEYNDFNENLAKFVRKNHVQTDKHWMNAEVTKNGLLDTSQKTKVLLILNQ